MRCTIHALSQCQHFGLKKLIILTNATLLPKTTRRWEGTFANMNTSAAGHTVQCAAKDDGNPCRSFCSICGVLKPSSAPSAPNTIVKKGGTHTSWLNAVF